MSDTIHSKASLLALLERAIQNAEPQEVIERLQWFVYFAEHRSISDTCSEFSIARSTFYRWYYRLDPEDLSSLRNLAKTQLLRPEPTLQTEHTHVCPFCKFCVLLSTVFTKKNVYVAIILLLLNISFILLFIPMTAKAAGTWSSTTLINTESFNVIDDGDQTTDVYIQFGTVLNKKLKYDITENTFHFDDSVEVIGTASGKSIHAQDALTSSGTLVWEGAASGATLTISNGFFGSGLTDCDIAATSKLLWDATTGRFSCGTDQGAGSATLQEAYDADADGSNTLITLTADDDSIEFINPATSGTDDKYVFSVKQQVTGYGSGMLIDSSAHTGAILTINGSTEGELTKGAPHILFGYNDLFDTNLFRSAANLLRTTASFRGANIHSDGSLTASGSLAIEDGQTVRFNGVQYLFPSTDGSANDFLQTDGAGGLTWSSMLGIEDLADPDADRILFWDDTAGSTQFLTLGTNLSIAGTTLNATDTSQLTTFSLAGDSGTPETIAQGNTLTIAGGTSITTVVSATDTVTVDVEDNSINGTELADTITLDAATLFSLGSRNLTFNATSSGQFEVLGTASGRQLHAQDRLSASGTLALDSASLYFNAFVNCSALETVGGLLTCGTDDTGAGGLTEASADARYVLKSGSTMTGALTIDLQNTKIGTSLIAAEQIRMNSGAVLSGSLVFGARNDPAKPNDDTLALYAKEIAGRMMLKAKGPSGLDYPYQPSFFQNQIVMVSSGGGTTVSTLGSTTTNSATISHPAASETFGYMTNFATSTSNGNESGFMTVGTPFFRGSTTGANGFFFNARVGVVDTALVRNFVGLSSQTSLANQMASDDVTGSRAGFAYSTVRGDSNWQVTLKDGTTQNLINSGVPYTASNVYDLYLFCAPQCTTITWRIDNVTAGTSKEGSTSSNLPAGATAMKAFVGVETQTTAAKSFRMQRTYIESDR